MKQRFRLYRRNRGTFYCHDSETGKQESLGTKNKSEAIIGMEWNPERKAFYELLWHLGGSQSDVASLCAEDIDWEQRVISYLR